MRRRDGVAVCGGVGGAACGAGWGGDAHRALSMLRNKMKKVFGQHLFCFVV